MSWTCVSWTWSTSRTSFGRAPPSWSCSWASWACGKKGLASPLSSDCPWPDKRVKTKLVFDVINKRGISYLIVGCELWLWTKRQSINLITRSLRYKRQNTRPGNNTCTWLRECCRQVEAEVVSNSKNQLHQTTYKYFFRAQYFYMRIRDYRVLNTDLSGAS